MHGLHLGCRRELSHAYILMQLLLILTTGLSTKKSHLSAGENKKRERKCAVVVSVCYGYDSVLIYFDSSP